MAGENEITTPRPPGTFIESFPSIINLIAENLEGLGDGLISLDIDAVTQATYLLALKKASRDLGLPSIIPKENLTRDWQLVEIVQKHGVSKEEALAYAKSMWNNPEVYLNSPAMPGIRSLLQVLQYVQKPHIFISSRPPEFLGVTQVWFAKTFPWIRPENVILGREEGESGGDFKAAVIKKYGVTLHLEDALEEAIPIVERTSAKLILVPQPWNIRENISHRQIKTLTEYYSETAGVWPVMRFLMSPEARNFLRRVAQ